ncbi:MAG: hypothetical protein DCC75_02865 [Proteobacteria bacterium]|nr:MAG: hypothetical protein DCC75_02865 [Pseudomonadota bacterium]
MQGAKEINLKIKRSSGLSPFAVILFFVTVPVTGLILAAYVLSSSLADLELGSGGSSLVSEVKSNFESFSSQTQSLLKSLGLEDLSNQKFGATESGSQHSQALFSIGKADFVQTEEAISIWTGSELAFHFSAAAVPAVSFLAAVRDPYTPLLTFAGDPFHADRKGAFTPAKNVVNLLDDSRSIKPLQASSFDRFPFFSRAATTIAVAYGRFSAQDLNNYVVLTLIDTADGRFLQISSKELAFPNWVDRAVYPPAFTTQRFISLSSSMQGLGDNVVDQFMRYSGGAYKQSDKEFQQLALEEIRNSKITQSELDGLARADLSKPSAMTNTSIFAIRKLTKLIYYLNLLGKDKTVSALLDSVHPSLRQALKERVPKGA